MVLPPLEVPQVTPRGSATVPLQVRMPREAVKFVHLRDVRKAGLQRCVCKQELERNDRELLPCMLWRRNRP